MKNTKKLISLIVFSLLICAVFCITAFAEQNWISEPVSGGFRLENDHIVISYNGKGAATEYFYKDTETSFLGSKSYFAILKDEIEEYYPSKIELKSIDGEEAVINVAFADVGVDFNFEIKLYDDFFTFELLEALPEDFTELSFCNVKLPSAYNGKTLAAFSYALDYNTIMGTYASLYHSYKSLGCTTYEHLGNSGLGAKIALIGCPEEEYYDVLRFIAQFVIDPNRYPVSNMGGAYAMTEEVLEYAVQDYVIISSNPTDETIRHYLDYNATQFDFHQGNNTFLQGSMDFAASAGDTAEGFKTQVTDRIKKIAKEEYGLEALMGLHTYAYYIAVNNTALLSKPETVRQLEYFKDELYTLSSAISKTQTVLPVFENCSEFDNVVEFFKCNSTYVRIDDELMKVTGVGGTNNLVVTRAQCGTQAAEHRKGSTVYHLTGLFGMLCPQMDSQLFIDIAKYTADAYVKGGFGMIYIDALDGLNRHTTDIAYYSGLFLTEIMKEINRLRDTYPELYGDTPDPIFEYSSFASSIWNTRTRTGAHDTVCRGLKYYIEKHTQSNATNPYNYSTNIGWWALYNSETNAPFVTHLQSWDVVDLLGKNIVAHNMGYSYNGFSLTAGNNPLHLENANLLVKYMKLRDAGYFTREVIEKISGYGDEWKLIEKDGEYGFEHRDYDEIKYHELGGTKNANNPFNAQIPALIRIQSLNTDAKIDYVTLCDFDESKAISDYVPTGSTGYVIDIDPTVNINTYRALVVRVYGNGLGGKICFSSYTDDTTYNRVVELDFTGWKDIVLVESDNGVLDFDFNSSISYALNRTTDTNLESFRIRVNGNMTGVILDTVKLGKYTYSSVTNPTVSYYGSKITFDTTLTGGNYIEFDGTRAVELARNGAHVKDLTYTVVGDLIAPTGDFNVSVSGTGANTTDRLWLTLGYRGEQIFNDLSNEAVEKIVVKTNPKKTSYTVGETLDTTGLSIYESMNTGRKRDVDGGWSVEDITFTESGIIQIPVTYNGFETTFAVVVHDIVPVELKIVKLPNRTTFYVGETLDTSGLVINEIYNNGTVKGVTKGYTLSIDKIEATGTLTVTITYGKLEASFDIEAVTPTLLGIEIVKLPSKTVYTEGELFSTAGMVVEGIYTNNIRGEITDYTFTPNGALTERETVVTVEKKGYRDTLTVTVLPKSETPAFELSAIDVVAVPGTVANVNVTAKAGTVTSIEGLEFTIGYDTSLVYSEVSVANLPDGWSVWDVNDSENGVLKIALIDEADEPVPVSLDTLSVLLKFTVPETVSNGSAFELEITDVIATDTAFSLVDGEGCAFTLLADTKIVLVGGSSYVIDRERGLLFISHAETSVEEFRSNIACDVSLSSSLAIVGTGVVVSLELDGVAVDSLTVILPGDVNGNGKIDSTDYTMAKRGYLGTLSLTAARSIGADANRNGYIDTSDYLLIKKHFSNEIDMYK